MSKLKFLVAKGGNTTELAFDLENTTNEEREAWADTLGQLNILLTSYGFLVDKLTASTYALTEGFKMVQHIVDTTGNALANNGFSLDEKVENDAENGNDTEHEK